LLALCAGGGCDDPSGAAQPMAAAKAQLVTEQPAAAKTADCGSAGKPDCPLQNWMKATLQTYQREKNYERLASSLEELARHAPEGYDGWTDTAKAGLSAARAKDEAGVRQSCKDCHAQLRARFKRELRTTRLF
jgi:hypothetical protein